MAERKLQHIEQQLTEEERACGQVIREGTMRDFPPRIIPAPPEGIPRRMHDARKQRGMSPSELGKLANVHGSTVIALERGEDVPLSQFSAVIAALGLTLEIVEQA